MGAHSAVAELEALRELARGAGAGADPRVRLVARLQFERALEQARGAQANGAAANDPRRRMELALERAEVLARLELHARGLAAALQGLEDARDDAERWRCWTAAGDAARRGGLHARAFELYGRALALGEPQVERDARDLVRYRLGLSALVADRPEVGRRALEIVAHDAWKPRRRIDACEVLARDALDRGDYAGAFGWLHAARSSVSESARAATPEGFEVRRALHRMRALDELRCAWEQRRFDENLSPLRLLGVQQE